MAVRFFHGGRIGVFRPLIRLRRIMVCPTVDFGADAQCDTLYVGQFVVFVIRCIRAGYL